MRHPVGKCIAVFSACIIGHLAECDTLRVVDCLPGDSDLASSADCGSSEQHTRMLAGSLSSGTLGSSSHATVTVTDFEGFQADKPPSPFWSDAARFPTTLPARYAYKVSFHLGASEAIVQTSVVNEIPRVSHVFRLFT